MTPLLVGLAVAVAAPGPKDPPKRDPPSLVGEWRVESLVEDGKSEMLPAMTLTFQANGKCFAREGDDPPMPATYTADPKKTPAEIDVTEGRGMGARPMFGIYKFDGDALVLCLAQKGDRPTDFTAAAGSRRVLVTLKRIKKD